ncbi:hypothetical protein STEG23_034864 [Scotinomys teguina]
MRHALCLWLTCARLLTSTQRAPHALRTSHPAPNPATASPTLCLSTGYDMEWTMFAIKVYPLEKREPGHDTCAIQVHGAREFDFLLICKDYQVNDTIAPVYPVCEHSTSCILLLSLVLRRVGVYGFPSRKGFQDSARNGQTYHEYLQSIAYQVEFVYMMDNIDRFSYVEPSLHLWVEAYLVRENDLPDVPLDLVFQFSIENVCINVLELECPS